MRRILVDVARTRQKRKRGGDVVQVSLDEALAVAGGPGLDVIALDDALKALAAFDERKSKVVELRYFGGLSVDETAEALGVSAVTVMRDWSVAKVWLLRELERAMTPEKWRAVERLYLAALERDAGERAGFLREACGADAGAATRSRDHSSNISREPKASSSPPSLPAPGRKRSAPRDRPPDRPPARFV